MYLCAYDGGGGYSNSVAGSGDASLPPLVTGEAAALRQVEAMNRAMGLGLPLETAEQLLAAGPHAVNQLSAQV